MTPFTTSKGEFIAVPVPDDAIDIISCTSGITYRTDGSYQWTGVLIYFAFEIIGLYSDILKDEELAKRVVSSYGIGENYTMLAGELLKIEGITGNQLIIRKQ